MAISNGDIRPVLRNLCMMLKPEGFLQWGETDINSPLLESVSPDSAYLKLNDALSAAYGGTHDHTWIPRLKEIFIESGMTNVEQEHMGMGKPELRTYFANLNVWSYQEHVGQMRSDAVTDLWKQCEKERAHKGVEALWDNTIAIGRKPKESA